MKFRKFMKFRKLGEALVRMNLKKRGFYENVTFLSEFDKKNAQKAIEKWMYDLLRYKNINVDKLKDLFGQLDEITFPIIVKKCYSSWRTIDMRIIDSMGNEFYMLTRTYRSYDNMQYYILGRRNSLLEPLIDRDFHYKICKDGTITLLETGAGKLNLDGTNGDIVVDFCFDSENHTTEAKLRSYAHERKIRIKYPTISKGFDKRVLKELLEEETTWYYYDVFPILRWIVPLISDKELSISIVAEIDGEISSQLEVVDGVVQQYTTTQVIHEGEMQITKRIIAKDLQEFLIEK